MQPSKTDRLLTRFVLIVMTLGGLYMIWLVGRPVYWRFYATVLNPFRDDSTQTSFRNDPLTSVITDGDSADSAEVDDSLITSLSDPLSQLKVSHLPSPPFTSPSPPPSISPPPPRPPPSPSPLKTDPKPQVSETIVPEDYPLTKQRAQALKQDGYLMVTWANHHYLDFARSWVYHVKKAGVTGYIVGAMDDDILVELVKEGINTWRMNTGLHKGDLGWGSPNFHKMGRSKIGLIKQVLELDVMVVISDIDTAWLQNPLPYFSRFPTADVLTSSDQLGPTVKDDSLEKYPDAGSSFNIGIMLFRQNSMAFVDQWIKELEKPQMWDQTAFNDLARLGNPRSEPPTNLFRGFNNKLTVGVLPVSLFASGHVFFVQHKAEELGLKAYVAHATFQYSGTPGKRHRFREALLWHDPPEYFTHPKGFIVFDMDIPPELLAAAKAPEGKQTADKWTPHLKLVHHQLSRIHNALAIASITGRALIMPEIWCGIDKYWAPMWSGTIPGSTFKLPFKCPMDHVFDLEGGWTRTWPMQEYGPHIDFREHSFLKNPRLLPSVRDNVLTVEICTQPGPGCGDGTRAARIEGGRVRVMPNLKSGELLVALKNALDAVKIVRFSTMQDMFGGWSAPVDGERFQRRLTHYTSTACCLDIQPGWIWYDFFHSKPHTDRFGRVFNGTWTVYRGDDGRHPGGRHLLSGVDSAADLAGMQRTMLSVERHAMQDDMYTDWKVESSSFAETV